jgi:hypothetical protein
MESQAVALAKFASDNVASRQVRSVLLVFYIPAIYVEPAKSVFQRQRFQRRFGGRRNAVIKQRNQLKHAQRKAKSDKVSCH